MSPQCTMSLQPQYPTLASHFSQSQIRVRMRSTFLFRLIVLVRTFPVQVLGCLGGAWPPLNNNASLLERQASCEHPCDEDLVNRVHELLTSEQATIPSSHNRAFLRMHFAALTKADLSIASRSLRLSRLELRHPGHRFCFGHDVDLEQTVDDLDLAA